MSPAPHTPQTAPGITVATGDADETRALGARLARLLRAGDLVMLSGGLGAGKTTLAQGIGAALEVRGRVSSPTFIIARVHPALSDGPDLIHVDAYRITSLEAPMVEPVGPAGTGDIRRLLSRVESSRRCQIPRRSSAGHELPTGSRSRS